MSLMCSLVNRAWAWSGRHATRQFERALRDPAKAQEHALLRMIRSNADTAFGRHHHFHRITNRDEFRRHVPIHESAAYIPWVDRIRRGEQHVLTTAPVRRLIPTSGTSGAAKYIPFTNELRDDFNVAILPWITDLFRASPDLRNGPAYWAISPQPAIAAPESKVPIEFGDDEDYLHPWAAALARSIHAVPASVRHITTISEWRRATALALLRAHDLRLISVWHPTFLELILEYIGTNWNDLLDDLRDDPRSTRQARQLESVNPKHPAEIWPRLQLVSAWCDAGASNAARALQRRLPSIPIQAKGLLATECVVSIPYRNRHPLALTSHFFEFEADDGSIHDAHQLELNETYTVIVSTRGGLVRYRLGDRIRVDGHLHATPSIRFLGRGKNTTDMRGEKLSESHVNAVLAELLPRHIPTATHATLIADESHARYILAFDGPSVPGLDSATAALDSALCENPHYAVCRELGQLESPIIIHVGSAMLRVMTDASSSAQLGSIKIPTLITTHQLPIAMHRALKLAPSKSLSSVL